MIALSIAIALAATYAFLLGQRYLASREVPGVSPETVAALINAHADLLTRIKALEVGHAFKRGA